MNTTAAVLRRSLQLLGKSKAALYLPAAAACCSELLRGNDDRFNPSSQYRYYYYSSSSSSSQLSSLSQQPRHGTTIVCVRKNGQVCMIGDGMVSQGSMIVKPNAVKLRRILPKTNDDEDEETRKNKATLVGFAGSTADAFTLLERLEGKLDEYPGQLARSCVELAKGWRTDKYLRRLEAALIVADASVSLELTGNGDVLEPHDGILGVGSGSPYAIAAARALIDLPDLSAEDVARKAMDVASGMCVYTNDNYLVETLSANEKEEEEVSL